MKSDAVLVLIHLTEKKSLKQQTGPDGVQATLEPTHNQRPKVGGGMLVSLGQFQLAYVLVVKKKSRLVGLTGL